MKNVFNDSTMFSGMPFNSQMSLPVELTLRSTPDGPRIFMNPVREVARLRASKETVCRNKVLDGKNLLEGISGAQKEILVSGEPKPGSSFRLDIKGMEISYDSDDNVLTVDGRPATLAPENGRISLRILADTRSVEIFGNGGRIYIPLMYEKFEDEGFVQPYGSGPRPMYQRSIGEDVYINILNTAKDYVWIMTPYLIIDYRLREALVMAAARGVDVRIITPHIPDKRVAFALTRSNYMALIRGGVRIYEYTPGFIHAKGFLADDKVGVVGTINCDYRSLLFHFEDAVLMYRTRALASMKQDFEETFAVSALQTEADAKRNVVWRGVCELAKIFAPLF